MSDEPHMPINRPWSAVDLACLRTWSKIDRKTYGQIALKQGRTRNAISGKIHHLKRKGLW